jgi:thiamine-phosphate pyrophosphorylase
MVNPGRIRGLYAITPDEAVTSKLIAQVKLALEGGTRWVQYRSKSGGKELKLQQAEALVSLCRQFGASLIVNDGVELARGCGAQGVHLGAQDMCVAAARSLLGPDKIIGASCYDQLKNALDAAAQGADYVALGSFFPSSVKPHAVRPSLALLKQTKANLKTPVVAVGGITLQNAGALIAAGADAVAVITALFNAPDIKVAAQKFNRLFANPA